MECFYGYMYSVIGFNYTIYRAHGSYEHGQNIPHSRPQSKQTPVITSVEDETAIWCPVFVLSNSDPR